MSALENGSRVADGIDRSRARARETRLALTKVEAAASLSMSVDSFERHVMPELRVVRRGRLVLVPVVELERWLERESSRTVVV